MTVKRNGIKGFTLLATAGLMFASCDLLKDLDYQVSPDPLEMHGGKVKIRADVTFPEKGINKKAYAEITPMIGTHALKTVTIVGEKATANGTVVPYKAGGKVVYEDVIDYTPDMEVSELTIKGSVYKKGKEKDQIEETKIADATIITPLLVDYNFMPIPEKDNFQRVTEQKQIAEINYLKGSPIVRPTEKKDADILELATFLTDIKDNPKIVLKNISINAFASIEGEETKNNTLSSDRATSAKKAVIEIAKSKKVANEQAADENIYNAIGKGEDYEGFKKGLQASTMDAGDKDRILTILGMYSSSDQRSQAVRDLNTYLYLDKNIFPAQRRSEISVNYDLTGFYDDELVQYSKTKIDTLDLEELLFTATLTDDMNEQLRLYKAAESKYPNDYRPSINIGVIYLKQNKLTQAKEQFEKANNINATAISKNNLATVAGIEGNIEKAKSLLAEASGAGSEVSYNKGIINIIEGEYEQAISNLGSEPTYNKSLAQLLNKDYAAASTTLNNSADAETAKGYYLAAIISSRQDNLQGTIENLGKAIAQDASYKEKAKKDREFIHYFNNPAFMGL